MPTVERHAAEGNRRALRALTQLADEFRDRRLALGLSQSEVASAAGVSRATYQRVEGSRLTSLSIVKASRIAAVLGLDLAVRAFPGSGGMRAAAHGRKLATVLALAGAPLSTRTEVPLPQGTDRRFEQRAWDALMSGADRRTAFEMEMRLRDGQALERRIELKRRDDPVDSLVLLIADTRTNRRILAENPAVFPTLVRLSLRQLATFLRAGQHPPSCLVLV